MLQRRSWGKGPRWLTINKPFPQPHLNLGNRKPPWHNNRSSPESSRTLKSVDGSMMRTSIFTHFYTILINYKGKTPTEWKNLRDPPWPSNQCQNHHLWHKMYPLKWCTEKGILSKYIKLEHKHEETLHKPNLKNILQNYWPLPLENFEVFKDKDWGTVQD